MELKTILAILLLPISVVSVSASILGEHTTTQELTIQSQTEFDQYVTWDFTRLTEFTWLARGRVDETFLEDAKRVEETTTRDDEREWNDFAAKYGITDATTARTSIERFAEYPYEENKDVTIQRLETTKETGVIELGISFPQGFAEGVSFKLGWNSTVINTTTSGIGGLTSETAGTKIAYSNISNALYALYAGSGADLYISSSGNNGTTWTAGQLLAVGTYAMSSANCALQNKNTTTDLFHCVAANTGVDTMQYIGFETTLTSPYYTLTGNSTPFDASAMGEAAGDRIFNPQMTIDAEGCKMVLIDFQDVSEVAADQHEVVLFRENETYGCNDTTWENNTMDNGFPIYSIQDEVGYANNFGGQIVTYTNGNLQLLWGNSDSTTDYIWLTKHYNATSKTVDGTQRQLHPDIEYGAFSSNLLQNGSSATLFQDDGASYWRVMYMYGENGTLSNITASTVTSSDSSGAREGTVTSVYNSYNNTVYYAYADSASQDFVRGRNLTVLNSTNMSVSAKMNISNYSLNASNNARDYSSYLDYENCRVHFLTTYGGSLYEIMYDTLVLETSVCPTAAPPTPSTDVYIDCSTNPLINTATNYNNTNVYANGSGTVRYTALLYNMSKLTIQKGCKMQRNNGGNIQT